MKKIFLLLFVFTLLLLASSVTQAVPLLGPAIDYNVFVFDSIDVDHSDSHGRIAAGGDIHMDNYSVGGGASLSDYSIVSGGNVYYGPGTISNGGIYAGGNLELTNYTVNGDVTANGTISYFNGGTVTGVATPGAGVASPIDFAAAESYLSGVSSTLAGMVVNGITDVQYNTNLHFWGDEAVNIFSLNYDEFKNVTNITFHTGDNVAIINISGIDYFPHLGINGAAGNDEHILWNFHEATYLDLNGTIRGSILAPNALVDFDNGNLWGTIVAQSLTGTEEYHYPSFEHDFEPDMQPVPEPSTLLLYGSGLIGLLYVKRTKTFNI